MLADSITLSLSDTTIFYISVGIFVAYTALFVYRVVRLRKARRFFGGF